MISMTLASREIESSLDICLLGFSSVSRPPRRWRAVCVEAISPTTVESAKVTPLSHPAPSRLDEAQNVIPQVVAHVVAADPASVDVDDGRRASCAEGDFHCRPRSLTPGLGQNHDQDSDRQQRTHHRIRTA